MGLSVRDGGTGKGCISGRIYAFCSLELFGSKSVVDLVLDSLVVGVALVGCGSVCPTQNLRHPR